MMMMIIIMCVSFFVLGLTCFDMLLIFLHVRLMCADKYYCLLAYLFTYLFITVQP